MKYRLSYLSNGRKVKITYELFNQLKVWEEERIYIEDAFKDELKRQDDRWINQSRSFYRNNLSFDYLSARGKEFPSIRQDEYPLADDILKRVYEVLAHCTELQKLRFIKHFFYGMSYHAIAKQEHRNKDTVRDSVKKAVQMLRNYE